MDKALKHVTFRLILGREPKVYSVTQTSIRTSCMKKTKQNHIKQMDHHTCYKLSGFIVLRTVGERRGGENDKVGNDDVGNDE